MVSLNQKQTDGASLISRHFLFALHQVTARMLLLLLIEIILATGSRELYAGAVLVAGFVVADVSDVNVVQTIVSKVPKVEMGCLYNFPQSFPLMCRVLCLRKWTGFLSPGDVVALCIVVCRPNQARLDLSAIANHTAQVKAALISLAPVRMSLDVGVYHVIGAIEHFGSLSRHQTSAAIQRDSLDLKKVLTLQFQVFQFVAVFIFKNCPMVNEYGIISWTMDQTAPKHFVECDWHVRGRLNPLQSDMQFSAYQPRIGEC